MAKINVEQPNKRNIERLFNEMSGYRSILEEMCYTYDGQKESDAAVDKLEEELHNSAKYKKAVAKRDKDREEYNKELARLKNKASKLRRLYYARGLTPAVLKQIAAFVDELNRR